MKSFKLAVTISTIFWGLFLGIVIKVNAGTCTSDSFTNISANSVLTSTKYNNDHSTIYNRLNGSLDGGCVSDGTLEDGALNTTDFAALLNGIHQGCKVTRSDASTLSVDKCILSLNGKFVRTTAANTVSFGCGSCSAETASTDYFLYAASTSTGTTLDLLILTSTPNNDGLDGSNNKVLARFYNNGSSDIDQYSVDQWVVNRFVPQETGWVSLTSVAAGTFWDAVTTAPTYPSGVTFNEAKWRRRGRFMDFHWSYSQINTTSAAAGSGAYVFHLQDGYAFDSAFTTNSSSTDPPLPKYGDVVFLGDGTEQIGSVFPYDSNSFSVLIMTNADGGIWASSFGFTPLGASSLDVGIKARFPIAGWGD